MKKIVRLLAMTVCLATAIDFSYAAGKRKILASEGIAMAEAESALYSDGYKITSVTILYKKKIVPSSVSPEDFDIPGQTIKSARVDGKKVILTFDCENRWYPEREDAPEDEGKVSVGKYITVTQKGDVDIVGGKYYYAGPASIKSKKISEPKIVKEFSEKHYNDDETGIELYYSLYLPLYYDKDWNYPVVVFIPDSRANTNISKSCILQGEGATVWATEAEQEKHKAIIIAVQYPQYTEEQNGPLVKEDGSWTAGLDAIYNLVRKELSNSRADRNRIYGVGQGEGAAANLLIAQKYPAFYAAQFAISPNYELKDTEVLERSKIWFMTSSKDRASCDAVEKAIEEWEEDGLKVNKALWKVDFSEKQFAKAAKTQADKKSSIKYTVIDGGCREYTWCIGHQIEEIRDWLFAQQ